MIKTKRIYEPADPSDGHRLLIMRRWPRGIKKTGMSVGAMLASPNGAQRAAPLRRSWFDRLTIGGSSTPLAASGLPPRSP